MGETTYVSALVDGAAADPSREVFRFLADGDAVTDRRTLGELDARARTIAAALRSEGLAAGDRALLLFPSGLSFLDALFGCMYAGVLAVPLGFPARPHLVPTRIEPVLASSTPRIVLAQTSANDNERETLARVGGDSRRLLVVDEVPTDDVASTPAPRAPGDLAYLQYTSGSTRSPKGAVVRHGHLVHNASLAQRYTGLGEDAVTVSWLPLFHDLGLVMAALPPVLHHYPCVLLPPESCLRRPVRWLRAITEHQATHSFAPNFGYELCVERISDEERSTLDLSSWRVALNGAEPVRLSTQQRFVAAFASVGFSTRAWCPAYGMTEHTAIITGNPPTEDSRHVWVDGAALEDDEVVVVDASAPKARSFVGNGPVEPDVELVVADRAGQTRDAGVGEMWLKSASVVDGYWCDDEATKENFAAYTTDGRGPFFRTGDLGFVLEGEVYLTGRAKDVLIIRGRNLYPQDLELVAEQAHPALRPGTAIAFGVDGRDAEEVVIAVEVGDPAAIDVAEVTAAVRRAIALDADVAVHDVCLLRPRGTPKTSSGKLQRRGCKAAYLAGELERIDVRS